MKTVSSQSLRVFYCYARKDQTLRDEIDIALAGLHRSGLITSWYDGEIVPGMPWQEEIKDQLENADIILLLVSSDFIHSDYCYSKEMKLAIDRHNKQEAKVIPILLRPTDWTGTPFEKLQLLPTNAVPITIWPNRDEAFTDVAKGIGKVVNTLYNKRLTALSSTATDNHSYQEGNSRPPKRIVLHFPLSLPFLIPQKMSPLQTKISLLITALLVIGGIINWLYHPIPPTNNHTKTMTKEIIPIHALTATAQAVATVTDAYNVVTAARGSMKGFDAQHTGENPYENLINSSNVSKLKLIWTFKTQSSIDETAVVVGGVVYISSEDHTIYALDAKTGSKFWSFSTGGSKDSSPTSPVVVNSIVYIGFSDGVFYALDVKTGSKLWSYNTPEATSFSDPIVANDIVYTNSGDNYLYALDAHSGKLLWNTLSTGIDSSPVISHGTIYTGSYSNHVYALDARSGKQRWAFQPHLGGMPNPYYGFTGTPTVANGVVYIGCGDHQVYALDAFTGSKLWSFSAKSAIADGLAVANGIVYTGSADHNIYALDAASGTKLWSFSTEGVINNASPVVANGFLYIGSYDDRLYAFSL